MSLRTPQTEQIYTEAKQNKTLVPLAKEPDITDAPEFMYWKIVESRFPYDRHHTKHDLIVLKRDCPPIQVNAAELVELWKRVMPWADERYDYIKFNLASVRSINGTPHLHLLTLKPEYK